MLPSGDELSRGERFLATAVRFAIQIGRQFGQDRCPRKAASLSFETLVAMVPLAAVVLSLTRWVEALGNRPAVERLLERFILPEAARDLSERLSGVAQRVDFEAIGWVGAGFLLLLGGLVFLEVEDILNDVWNVPRGRPLWRRMLALCGIVLLALPAAAAGLYLSVERLASPWDILAPAGLLLAALVLVYKLMPHVRVRWRSALAGALAAAVLLGVGHELFGVYIEHMRWRYESIYGAIAVVPMSMLWIYLAWIFFLLGAEVAYTSQHLDALWARARRSRELQMMRQDMVGGVSWPNAIRLTIGVAVAEAEGAAPVDPELVALRLSVPVDAAGLIVSRLAAAQILRRDPEGRLSLARPATEIRLVDVYDAVVDRRSLGFGLGDLVERQRETLGDSTLADRVVVARGDTNAD